MTTTELIEILKTVEKGASGRSREISIYKRNRKGELELIISRNERFEILSTGDGCAGAELSLIITNTKKQQQSINEKIKEARLDKGMTQKELAEKAGVSRRTIQAIEAGETYPSIKVLEALGYTIKIIKKEEE